MYWSFCIALEIDRPRRIRATGYAEWEPTLLLSRTVVPWAVLWFYYFEIWLVTGEWPGNGAHPIVTP
jgi:hypothetical protein